ncbi:histidine kinase [Streptomyces sp. NRRL F-5053]|uniref:sensor histidine kinase n=1 Tax=Streptomyces sp. NRRL F-5053 TaxID=1463854 RepID=UPI0007C4F66C|nr:histidine kinase [Streptomyces sp. NRRL F-5053]
MKTLKTVMTVKTSNNRLLPVLLLGTQAAVWPGAALLRGAAPAAAELLAAAVVAGVVAAALGLRRAHPVPALLLVTAACALGADPLPTGALAVLGTAGVALALGTVAVEHDTTTALLCTGTLAVWQAAHGITLHGLGDHQGLGTALTALLYAAATGAGMRLRAVRATRRAAELRLRRAESERHRLPAAERRRMERELHDVSAHHLTGVVVTVEAARGLRERRPEMAGQALEFAAETGRQVTRALGAVRAPAPSADDVPAPEERLRELVAGFRSLGQPVTCDLEALPEGAVGDAAYGIVREALTNVVRYASGAATTVRCTYDDDRTEIVVSNAPPDASAGPTARGAGLGGGRGQNLLRGRAREAGGTLTTGPTPEGGWEVRAVLPGRSAEAPSDGVPRRYRVAQFAAAAGLLVQPLVPSLVLHDTARQPGHGVPAGLLFALLAAAQVTALLWLRRQLHGTDRSVSGALGALLVLAGLWPAAVAAGDYAGVAALPPALGMLATCVALAVLAARGAAGDGGPVSALAALPRPAVPAVAAAVHAVAGTGAVLACGVTAPLPAVAGVATAAAAAAAASAWGLGTWYGGRGRAAEAARDEQVAAWTQEAVRDAWAERRRITAGLETTVLARAADMIAEAEAGRLEETAARARDALAAMRSLLDTVRDGEQHAALRPQPTLEALDLLVQQYRATGREVEVRFGARLPERLPAEVDLAAYRAAEIILEAAGDAPARLMFDLADGELTLDASGVPRATRPASRERLAVRAAALGGTVTTRPPDAVRLRLPRGAEHTAGAPAAVCAGTAPAAVDVTGSAGAGGGARTQGAPETVPGAAETPQAPAARHGARTGDEEDPR